ncbi:MAG: hypothetical protein K2X35_04145 [Bryobacteraceae bacterium]|nr:hypothetical protein [Bryobacteraceae bacterium]
MKAALLMAAAAITGPAECIRRPFTEAEQRFIAATLEGVRQALPAAPSGWRFEDRTSDRIPTSGCVDSGPLRFDYQAVYLWEEGGKQRQERAGENARRAGELKNPPPEVQKRIRDAESQAADRLRRVPRAVSANNLALAEQLNREAREFSAQANELKRKHEESVRAEVRRLQTARMEEEREQSLQVQVSVGVNEPPPDGISGIARREDGATIVFHSGKPRKPRLAIHGLVIHVIGDPVHVNSLLNSWDTARLRRMAFD